MTIFWTIILGLIGSLLGGALTHMFSRPSNPNFHPAGLIFSTLGAILVLLLAVGAPVAFLIPILLMILPFLLPGYVSRKRQHPNRAAIRILTVVSVVFAVFFGIGVIVAEANPDFFGRTQISPLAWICAFVAVLAWIVALVWAASSHRPAPAISGGNAPAAPNARDTQQRLQTLSDLLAQGNISEEEYQAKRQDILSHL